MKCFNKIVVTAYTCLIIMASCLLTTTESKTTNSRVSQTSSNVSPATTPRSNVLYSVAKSLATEALSQFQETARRNPRLGFNITMLLPPSLTGNNGTSSMNNLLDTTAQLGIIGLKGGILGLKAAVIQTVVLVLFIVFLLSGIAYFACNIGIISCTNVGGSLSNLGGGLGGASYGQLGGGNPFARAGYDYHHNLHRSTSAVYNAIDDGQKKYT